MNEIGSNLSSREPWVLTLVVLPLLMFAAPGAMASGFGRSELEAAARTADTIHPAIERETEALRLALAFNPAAGIGSRTEGEQLALIGALGIAGPQDMLRAKWFMAGAIAQPSEGHRTALYNPLARGWLVLDWEQVQESWQVTAARVFSAGPVVWQANDEPWRRALVSDYASARENLSVLPGGQTGREADRWIGGLALWLRDPDRLETVDAVRGQLLRGRIGAGDSAAIALIPEAARRTFWPIGAMPRGDGGGAVLFGSALLPHLLIAADLSPAGGLERLSLINFLNSGAGQ